MNNRKIMSVLLALFLALSAV